MQKSELQTLLDYNYWANGRVLRASGLLTPAQWIAPAGLSFGSIRGSLVHVLGAEIVWRRRIQEGISLVKMPGEDELPTLADVRRRWADEETAMRAFVGGLDDEGCGRVIHYTSTRGVPYQNPIWQLIAHVVNHGTQFRGEAAVALTHFSHSPGDLDLIAFLRGL